ncbi:AI-2E family transporter [Tissierella praeacuta]|uniref:AI-2E family transporter n=1 Tax=Tissierella praeacuta TaxID=43131 RepID=UPI0033407C56
MNDKKDFLKRVIDDTGKGIKGYIKAQITLMFITFIILNIGLALINVPHPILISGGISILDVIPVLGAGIVMIPWSIISFIMGNKDLGLNLAILYVILVILRQFIEPKIVGKEIGVRPLYTFIATILGAMILGPIGIMLGPIIAVIINSIMKIKNELNNRR